MPTLTIKKELLVTRCEICHKTDKFNAKKNYCKRCGIVINNNGEIVLQKQNTVNRFLNRINNFLAVNRSPFFSSAGSGKSFLFMFIVSATTFLGFLVGLLILFGSVILIDFIEPMFFYYAGEAIGNIILRLVLFENRDFMLKEGNSIYSAALKVQDEYSPGLSTKCDTQG